MTTRAQALSDAIHAKLFPQSSRIIRHEESRRIIAELIAEHFPEPPAPFKCCLTGYALPPGVRRCSIECYPPENEQQVT